MAKSEQEHQQEPAANNNIQDNDEIEVSPSTTKRSPKVEDKENERKNEEMTDEAPKSPIYENAAFGVMDNGSNTRDRLKHKGEVWRSNPHSKSHSASRTTMIPTSNPGKSSNSIGQSSFTAESPLKRTKITSHSDNGNATNNEEEKPSWKLEIGDDDQKWWTRMGKKLEELLGAPIQEVNHETEESRSLARCTSIILASRYVSIALASSIKDHLADETLQCKSQPDPQGTQHEASLEESRQISSSYSPSNQKLGFKPGVKVKQALELIQLKKQIDANENSIAETKQFKRKMKEICENYKNFKKTSCNFEELTQTVVNRLIDHVLPDLREYVREQLQNMLDEGITLEYYRKNVDGASEKTSKRKPDSLLYRVGTNADRNLTREAQTIAALVSFEHKANLGKAPSKEEALDEIRRDTGWKINDNNIHSPEIGYSVITDGIEWQFYRMPWTYGSGTFNMGLEWSPTITLGKGGHFEFGELARWLLFILKCSLVKPNEGTGRPKGTLFQFDGEKSVKLEEYLRLRGGIDRPEVARVRCDNTLYVMKFPIFDIHYPEYGLKMAKRLVYEREWTKMFEDCPYIVSLAKDEDLCSIKYALFFEDAGTALDKMIISGDKGKELAKVVYNDIWKGALKALKECKVCFADIHPGNICVKKDDKGKKNGKDTVAKLIDLESMTLFEEDLDHCPILLRASDGSDSLAPKIANAGWDSVSVAAILRCLWEDGSFDKLKNHAKEYQKDEKQMNDFIADFEASNDLQ